MTYMLIPCGLGNSMEYCMPIQKHFVEHCVLLQIYFGTIHAKVYLVADRLGFVVLNGMSCLFRKHVLDGAGGLPILGAYISEDYKLGLLFSNW